MSCSNNDLLVRHLCQFIGDTVTIFTTSGGASGAGFIGVLLAVNHKFVRLLTRMGEAPASPLNCSTETGGVPGFGGFPLVEGESYLGKHPREPGNRLGSVCDIPVDRIAAFCHNAV